MLDIRQQNHWPQFCQIWIIFTHLNRDATSSGWKFKLLLLGNACGSELHVARTNIHITTSWHLSKQPHCSYVDINKDMRNRHESGQLSRKYTGRGTRGVNQCGAFAIYSSSTLQANDGWYAPENPVVSRIYSLNLGIRMRCVLFMFNRSTSMLKWFVSPVCFTRYYTRWKRKCLRYTMLSSRGPSVFCRLKTIPHWKNLKKYKGHWPIT